VLAVQKEFVADGENSFWSFCVEYLDGTAAATGGRTVGSRVPKVDYKEVLKPEEFELFIAKGQTCKPYFRCRGGDLHRIRDRTHRHHVVNDRRTRHRPAFLMEALETGAAAVAGDHAALHRRCRLARLVMARPQPGRRKSCSARA